MSGKHGSRNNETKNIVKSLEILLRQNSNFGNRVVVVKCHVEQLIPFGENYASRILKVNARIKRDEHSQAEDFHFVAKKIMEPDRYWTLLLEKEIFMYNVIVPFYQKIERDIGISDRESITHIFPKLYGHRMSLNPKINEVDDEALILLENLRGYSVKDKNLGLDHKHATVAIQHLAKFHAMGIVAKTNDPIGFEKIKTEALKPGFDRSEPFIRALVNIVKKAPCSANHMKRIEELAAMSMEEVSKQLTRNDLWTTIIHHDFWTNNIMFHQNAEGHIDGVKIIDFQTFSYAHIFADFPYFLCSSLKQEVMMNNFNEILDVYHAKFIETLNNMGLNTTPFCRIKFDKQLKEDAALEFLHCVIALLYFTTDVASFNEKEQENINQAILDSGGNEIFFAKLPSLFEIYERKKWLYKDEKENEFDCGDCGRNDLN